jgi:hypothetical protein
MGSVVASLIVTSLGMSSHVSVLQNTTGAAVGGQTVVLGSGSLNAPTLITSDTTPGEFIAGGTSTGAPNATKAHFNVVAVNGNATITELKFKNVSVDGTITAVSVGSASATTLNDIAYLTGLNINVPNNGGGADIYALASYAPVGTTGVNSGQNADLALCSIKYTIGGTTATAGDTSCASPLKDSGQTMVLVGSAPSVTVATPASSILSASSNVEAIDVTVTANAAGPITLNSFVITSTLSAGTGSPVFATGPVIVKDGGNNNVSVLAASACAGTATCTPTITFGSGITAAPYLISAGGSQTFKIFLPISATIGSGTLPNTYMNTHLTSGTTDFSWVDTAGSASSAQVNPNTIFNYPSTTTSSVHN